MNQGMSQRGVSVTGAPRFEALEPRQLLDAIPLTEANNFTHTFMDSDGDQVTVTLRLVESGVLTLPDGSGDATSLSIISSDPNASASFVVRKGGPARIGETTLGALELNGVLKLLNAPKVTLTGAGISSFDEEGCIRIIKLNHILNGADINLPGDCGPVNFQAGFIGEGETSMVFGSEVRTFKILEWGDVGTLDAQSLGSLTTKRGNYKDMGETFFSFGDLFFLTADIDEGVRSINVQGVMDGLFTVGDDVRSVKVREDNFAWFTVGGDIGAFSVGQDFNAQLEMDRLNKLTVKGWIESSRIDARLSINAISALAIADTAIFAGVDIVNDVNADEVWDLPANFNDLLHPGPGEEGDLYFIKSVTVKGDRDSDFSFFNTNIAANTIGRLTINFPQTNNEGIPFGAAAATIRSVTVRDEDGRQSFRNLDDPGESLVFGDMEIRILA